ncbi:tetratricopeptide (TPR) repeat protein [Loktanella ponticola]|uniref:Tetratricopeptide (TPR) repeat protein n=1 Tax=Yoonia ponticola TaxID=1524255 RepID=A0A7W9BLP2_9RHOB|nr:tetratricopeptide repeat protein [Yoonia ponticola]MBB5722760.1 tetratricopeptide (TPR) repeat protein [Yoonia ponticola]
MTTLTHLLKRIVTAFFVTFTLTTPSFAQETVLDGLFQELKEADEDNHMRVADRMIARFEQSGSAAMDLLLRRGGDALEDGDDRAAIEHLTALVDHAPEFAEAYHLRATAYFRTGLIGPALDDLRQTLVLNPRQFRAMFGVGILMEELGRRSDAIAAYQAVLEIYPLEPEATDALARLALEIEGQAI